MASPPPPPASPPASPPPPSVASKKRRRAPPAASSYDASGRGGGDEDDGAIDDLLEALGIPDSDKKRRQQRAAEVIELLTPPRTPTRYGSAALRPVGATATAAVREVLELNGSVDDHPPAGGNRRQSLVDLTSPDQSGRKSKSPAASVLSVTSSPSSSPNVMHARSAAVAAPSLEDDVIRVRAALPSSTARAADAPLSQPTEHELLLTPSTPTSDEECDAMLDDLLLMRPLAERIAAARNHGGESLHTTHAHNNKPLAAEIEAPFESSLANVIRWERRERVAPAIGASRRPRSGAGSSSSSTSAAASAAPATMCSLLSAAIYFQADAFVELLQRQSYSEVLRIVRSLKSDLHARADRLRPQQATCAVSSSEIQVSTFLIIEGMDKCLIKLKKTRTGKSAAQQPSAADPDSSLASSTPSMPMHLSFSDVHEMAFQLFMDAETHTQFTVDLEDTAAYVALATREMVLAAAKKSVQEDFLESAPRLHSFRVTAGGATTNNFANAWLRMLQMVPGVSEDKAQSVLDHFPTVSSLLLAYSDPSLSREAKEDLLASRLAGRGLGRALSKRIFNVFCVDDPDALI